MAITDGLYRMNRLLEVLGNPEENIRALHIAGTNGKGSTAVFIASILEAAGYTTGLYTSPHLEVCNERIQLWNGEHHMIADDEYSGLEEQVNAAELIIEGETDPQTGDTLGKLHFFEKITAVAYLYYAEKQPDYVVLECGLGGRLDSTNTLEHPLVSVLTQIGMDHTAELGRTIYKIIHEKAGIIKPGVPVVAQSHDLTTQQILRRTATANGCEYVDASAHRNKFRKYELGMKGIHQLDNAATAVLAIQSADIEISEAAIEEGLRKAVIPGRFEVLKEDPYWIIDGAHNPDAVNATIKAFNYYKKEKKIAKTLVLFGCMNDKNYIRMIQLMHNDLRNCDYMTVDFYNERGASAETLGKIITQYGHECLICESVDEAFEAASLGDYDCVLTIGSIYLAGAMRTKIL